MSETTPNRTVTAPPARRAPTDLSRLVAANRSEAPEEPLNEPENGRTPPSTVKKPASPLSREGERTTITAYMSVELRERARATFLATRNATGDSSFSDFVARAILAEITRREADFNRGNAYPRDSEQLPSGRPLK